MVQVTCLFSFDNSGFRRHREQAAPVGSIRLRAKRGSPGIYHSSPRRQPFPSKASLKRVRRRRRPKTEPQAIAASFQAALADSEGLKVSAAASFVHGVHKRAEAAAGRFNLDLVRISRGRSGVA
jgi:hypothetical protein